MGTHIVTGAAGFIGSSLCDALLEAGHEVVGIDCFTDYYDVAIKRQNIASALKSPHFRLAEIDLRTEPLEQLLRGADCVYHQAGQPGVRLSWAEGFEQYVSCNVLATQRLLEAAKTVELPRFVYASSSSVYGNADRYPVVETDLPRPNSPYGVTKLAGEHLTGLYAQNWGLSTLALRYFTVYGPRGRPDMAIHRLIRCAQSGDPFPLYGDGSHVRDFTYVGDIVSANLMAGSADTEPGLVVNVCAGGEVVVSDLITAVGAAVGRTVNVEQLPEQPGDVQRTGGNNTLAANSLGWRPETTLADGIAAQVATTL